MQEKGVLIIPALQSRWRGEGRPGLPTRLIATEIA
jgi:hypothetical protein